MSTIRKLLIANRGEIACRVIRTARRMGIHTVAVFSEMDQHALHVSLANEAVCVGAAAATESYLNIPNILNAAKQTGSEAIHPGYGFLSENASFARACEAAGIIFVGPTPAAMDAMASKSAAKQLMQNAGVPVLPGYHGDSQDPNELKAIAEKTGYPLMLKASAGGGGKGMRIVMNADEFEPMLATVKREAMASFGDDHVLFERYVEQPRHIEIQVFSDAHGNHLHLFERDCSVQRRHQKVLEEAPAPHLTTTQRNVMGDAAVNAAKTIDYRGAGTVEFIADPNGQFFFMEMNTRLQVEHPVTEMISQQDLVEWQLRVASGEPLPATQEQLRINGHAIEARIYAEDTSNGFLPATGKLELLQFPQETPFLRVETGVVESDTVSMFYDPMIAKLVAWGKDRAAALHHLDSALAQTLIIGPATNVQYLRYLVAQPRFAQGEVDTGFIASLSAASSDQNALRSGGTRVAAGGQQAQFSAEMNAALMAALWNFKNLSSRQTRHWRMNLPDTDRAFWQLESGVTNEIHQLAITRSEHGYSAWINEEPVNLGAVLINCDRISIVINNIEFEARIRRSNSLFGIFPESPFENSQHQQYQQRTSSSDAATNPQAYIKQSYVVRRLDAALLEPAGDSDAGSLLAPMPGKIISVQAKAGDHVCAGDPLMVLEAMKMEHVVVAPHDGIIEEVCFGVNELVLQKALLVKMQETERS